MKVKTADLIGRPLSYAVAICEGLELDENNVPIWFDEDGLDAPRVEFSPWEIWSQAGPILDREWIELGACHDQRRAVFHGEDGSIYQDGPTPLIAVCRCFVASRLGDEVDIPDELV